VITDQARERFAAFADHVRSLRGQGRWLVLMHDNPDPDALAAAREAFGAALDDDLGISPALAVLFELARNLNRRIDSRALSTRDAERALGLLRDLDQVLGVLPEEADALDAETAALLEARASARAARDWAASDRLRDELTERGVAVEDTRDGQRWRRLSESVHG